MATVAYICCSFLDKTNYLCFANLSFLHISKELMFQQVIRRFAHFNAIQLSEPAPLPELLILALKDEDLESGGDNDDELRKKIAEVISLPYMCFLFNVNYCNIITFCFYFLCLLKKMGGINALVSFS